MKLFSYRLNILLALSVCLPSVITAQSSSSSNSDDALPLFELDEMEVIYSPTDFAPYFKGDSPQFAYYDIPTLPRGELIHALEFMDRYRDSLVPGSIKWAGMLHFPIIDGQERWILKYLCLYFYDNAMYAFDPSAEVGWQTRFKVPIQFEDRNNKQILFRFAESYVDDVYPEREEEYYLVQTSDPTDPEANYEEILETIFIPAGRIDGFLRSHKGKEREELVNIVYQFSEIPNPGTGTEAAFGKFKGDGDWSFSWKNLLAELSFNENYITTAAKLLKPRWTQPVRFHYEKEVLFWDIQNRARALLFNIGPRLYVYSPKYGVWRTDATLNDIEDKEGLPTKLMYPGAERVNRVEFLENELQKELAAGK